MAEQAQHPFDGYTLYVVLHKQEGRRMANLVKSKEDRTTISYARYLMSVHLGRKLLGDENVDHINNDKLDDRIENFQILTREENTKKENALRPAKVVEMVCPICESPFTIAKRNLPFRKNPTCSKKCGRVSATRKIILRSQVRVLYGTPIFKEKT